MRCSPQTQDVDDQINTPTVADDLALALLHVVDSGSEGLMHIAGADRLSRYD